MTHLNYQVPYGQHFCLLNPSQTFDARHVRVQRLVRAGSQLRRRKTRYLNALALGPDMETQLPSMEQERLMQGLSADQKAAMRKRFETSTS
jgi:hypothetical protein